jgi:protoporphyrinogen oxidase
VIGAGLAGLAAAYTLAKAGVDVALLERDEVVGGRAKTVNVPLSRSGEGRLLLFRWKRFWLETWKVYACCFTATHEHLHHASRVVLVSTSC